MARVLMIAATSSMDYDDRIRKECASIQRLGHAETVIFASEEKKAILSVPGAKLINPNFRIPNRPNILIKLFKSTELNVRLRKQINYGEFDTVWFHDPIQVLTILTLKKRTGQRWIWDMHELPPEVFFKNKWLKKLMLKAAKRCDEIIVANKERGHYMQENNMLNNFRVLHNYPDRHTQQPSDDHNDPEFEAFIKGHSYAYCQSATHPLRNFPTIARACIAARQRLVVPGEKNEIYEQLKNEIPEFDRYIKVLGKKPGFSLGYYLKRADFSIVIYSRHPMNNYLCAPNRLYHSLTLSVPVITGANPTMAEIIDANQCGIVLNSFGDDEHDLQQAIHKMNKNNAYYRQNTQQISSNYWWDIQDDVLDEVLE